MIRQLFHSSILVFSLSACVQNAQLVFNDQKAALNSQVQYSVSLQMTNRRYVESVFIQVFSIPDPHADRDTLKTMIHDKKEFGGGCDPYAVSEILVNGTTIREFPRYLCVSGLTQDLNAVSNPMRYSWTAKACDLMIMSRPARLAAAMNQIIPGWSPNSSLDAYKPNPETISKAYDLFFQGRVPDQDVVNALMNLGKTASTQDAAWKLILTTLCVSPEWQAL